MYLVRTLSILSDNALLKTGLKFVKCNLDTPKGLLSSRTGLHLDKKAAESTMAASQQKRTTMYTDAVNAVMPHITTPGKEPADVESIW
jgi:hypothetical protein